MKKRGMKIKHAKLRGEWAELQFMARAIELGLRLSKPCCEVTHYDFVVEHDGVFVRVQVKSTMFKDWGGYSCTVRGREGPYQGDPFDFLAAYVFQEELWYIIPAGLVVGQGSIALYPRLKRSRYGEYKEAWHLLKEGARVEHIETCADESFAEEPLGDEPAGRDLPQELFIAPGNGNGTFQKPIEFPAPSSTFSSPAASASPTSTETGSSTPS